MKYVIFIFSQALWCLDPSSSFSDDPEKSSIWDGSFSRKVDSWPNSDMGTDLPTTEVYSLTPTEEHNLTLASQLEELLGGPCDSQFVGQPTPENSATKVTGKKRNIIPKKEIKNAKKTKKNEEPCLDRPPHSEFPTILVTASSRQQKSSAWLGYIDNLGQIGKERLVNIDRYSLPAGSYRVHVSVVDPQNNGVLSLNHKESTGPNEKNTVELEIILAPSLLNISFHISFDRKKFNKFKAPNKRPKIFSELKILITNEEGTTLYEQSKKIKLETHHFESRNKKSLLPQPTLPETPVTRLDDSLRSKKGKRILFIKQ